MPEQFKEDFSIRIDANEPETRIADESKARYLADEMSWPMETALRAVHVGATASHKEAVIGMLSAIDEVEKGLQYAEETAERYSNTYDKEQEVQAMRFDLPLDQIVETTSTGADFTPKGQQLLFQAFEPKIGWCWHRLLIARDEAGKMVDYTIVVGNNGSVSRLVRPDPETGKLALGDEHHNFTYDLKKGIFIGRLGGGSHDLDSLGRNINNDGYYLSEEEREARSIVSLDMVGHPVWR